MSHVNFDLLARQAHRQNDMGTLKLLQRQYPGDRLINTCILSLVTKMALGGSEAAKEILARDFNIDTSSDRNIAMSEPLTLLQ